jgi:effector-binding domain-containing protein
MSLNGKIAYKAGMVRLDATTPSGPMIWVAGMDRCWQKMGQVVVPCPKEMTNLQKVFQTYSKASDLAPLREESYEVQASGQEKVGAETFDVLTVKASGLETPAKFFFDPKTHLVSRMAFQVTLGGQTGEMVGTIKWADGCGTKMVANFKTTFMGNLIGDEELSGTVCKPLEDKLFEQPEQVADGTIIEKETGASTVACTKMKGPYTGTGKAIEGLMGFLGKQKLQPTGAPMMIYLKAPPKVKKPKKYLTEICFPVAAKAPKKPKKKGKFVIKAMKSRKVLAAYGVGPYETKSPELMKLLIDEAKKRKLKTAGPMCQISFMDPKETAAEELVSEMQIPIKGGKKKKK